MTWRSSFLQLRSRPGTGLPAANVPSSGGLVALPVAEHSLRSAPCTASKMGKRLGRFTRGREVGWTAARTSVLALRLWLFLLSCHPSSTSRTLSAAPLGHPPMGPSPWLPDILKPWLLSVVVSSAEWAGENQVMPQGIAWVPTVVLLPLFCSYGPTFS